MVERLDSGWLVARIGTEEIAVLTIPDLEWRLYEKRRWTRGGGEDAMSRKRMPGGIPEPGWTLEEHQQAVAQFHEGIANGLNPEWPPPRESLMPDGRITAPGYVFVAPGRRAAQIVPVPVSQLAPKLAV